MDFPHRLSDRRIVILVSTTPQPNSQARRIPRIPHMGSTRRGHLTHTADRPGASTTPRTSQLNRPGMAERLALNDHREQLDH